MREKRSTLEDLQYDLETEKESLESLRSERMETKEEFENLPDAPAGELSDLESRGEQLRTRKQELEAELNNLQSLIQLNEGMLEGGADELLDELTTDDSDSVTDELLPDETVTCWTCGSTVDTEQIEATVETLRDLN
jgi:chromosome segregation ATPase